MVNFFVVIFTEAKGSLGGGVAGVAPVMVIGSVVIVTGKKGEKEVGGAGGAPVMVNLPVLTITSP